MLSRLLRVFLLYLVHLVYALFEVLHDVRIRLHDSFLSFTRKVRTEDELFYISKHVRCLKRRPSHIAVITTEDSLRYSDLAKLIVWSLCSGVSFISFYDKNGIIKENEDRLLKAVEKAKVGIPGHIRWKNHSDINGYTNGTNHKITVAIYSECDGREVIADFARSVCDSVIKDELKTGELTVESVDRDLRCVCPIAVDPELIIHTDRVCCSYGFPPWFMRLSEFHGLSFPHRLSVTIFTQILQKYSNCQQRCGT